jgi:hypothetical protein
MVKVQSYLCFILGSLIVFQVQAKFSEFKGHLSLAHCSVALDTDTNAKFPVHMESGQWSVW